MKEPYDRAKNAANRLKHGLTFADFTGFDSPPAVRVDGRRDYGEERQRAFGRIAGQGYCLVYVVRDGQERIISFRRAHEKEMRRYGL